ncbi:MAG: UDP-2,4-diacetamido-2,4,6-trideoxy-beta-L-altropyranose hydrolase [Deltaproteobacteria bacterium]|nr:UDP-2,4-diacetamido-2,4,6-trideoxy-beta-L-altropyranose hydrolase [Deltaproteobacteria bacterium]
MKFVIRTDSSFTIGSGHVVRCLTLAQNLQRWGHVVSFVCKNLDTNLNHLVSEAGFDLHQIDAKLDTQDDALQTAELIHKLSSDWLIVDHYGLDQGWEEAVRTKAQQDIKIFAIDDGFEREHAVDLFLNQSSLEQTQNISQKIEQALIGPHYALLRPQFFKNRPSVVLAKGLSHLMVFFGGTDPLRLSLPVIKTLSKQNVFSKITVVITSQHPDKEDIKVFCDQKNVFELKQDVADMAALMAQCDLYLGAAGTITWERCCLGLTGAVVTVSDNQIPIAEALDQQACHVFLADGTKRNQNQILKEIENFHWQKSVWQDYRQNSLGLVDGLGVQRVTSFLDRQAVYFEEAKADDSKMIWQWRNSPEVRKTALDQSEIPWDNHKEWFKKVLQDPNRKLLVAYAENQKIGVVRFDLQGNEAEISIFLDPDQIGRSWGVAVLNGARFWLQDCCAKIQKIKAVIREDNPRSQIVFERAGYAKQEHAFERQVR